jgi:hypothetical protein
MKDRSGRVGPLLDPALLDGEVGDALRRGLDLLHVLEVVHLLQDLADVGFAVGEGGAQPLGGVGQDLDLRLHVRRCLVLELTEAFDRRLRRRGIGGIQVAEEAGGAGLLQRGAEGRDVRAALVVVTAARERGKAEQ